MAYDETNGNNDKNCSVEGKSSDAIMDVDLLRVSMRSFWEKSGDAIFDTIAITQKRHL